MLNFKCNFKNQHENYHCSRCDQNEEENENHIFGNCNALTDLYDKYKIQNYDEVFNENTSIHRYEQISLFIKDIFET